MWRRDSALEKVKIHESLTASYSFQEIVITYFLAFGLFWPNPEPVFSKCINRSPREFRKRSYSTSARTMLTVREAKWWSAFPSWVGNCAYRARLGPHLSSMFSIVVMKKSCTGTAEGAQPQSLFRPGKYHLHFPAYFLWYLWWCDFMDRRDHFDSTCTHPHVENEILLNNKATSGCTSNLSALPDSIAKHAQSRKTELWLRMWLTSQGS